MMACFSSPTLAVNPIAKRIPTKYQAKSLNRSCQVENMVKDKSHSPKENTLDQIQSKCKELERRNQELESFARIVTHDLKSPLSSIMVYCALLKDNLEGLRDEATTSYIDGIAENSLRMKRIINEILLLSEIQQRRVKPKPIDMGKLVAGILKSLEPMIERYRGNVSFPQTWHPALGHAPWIEEVWTNYITNAIKYGGQPPDIQLGSTRLADNMVGFWVRDNGDGLTKVQQARLFHQFTQLDNVRLSGHGLGLWIVKRITNKLAGDAWVESEGQPGEGCIFYFSLPGTNHSPR